MTEAKPNTEGLIKRLSRPRIDQQAWEEFVQGTRKSAWSGAMSVLDVHHDGVEDVVQTTYLDLVRNRQRWPEKSANISGLVYTTARNRAIDTTRRREIRPAEVLVDFSDPSVAAIARNRVEENSTVERLDLHTAIEKLPPRQREVIQLMYLNDLKIIDIAATLGISIGTVKNHLNRALTALRKQLEPNGSDQE